MSEESTKALNKTLTFGLGQPLAFDIHVKSLANLEEDQRKKVYQSLREGAKTIAMICNVETAKEYARRVLGVPKKKIEQFNPGYNNLPKRLDGQAVLSGSVLSQTYQLGSNPHFQGEHLKDLLLTGKQQLPTHRIDGTHPIMMRAAETKLFQYDRQFYLASQVFSMEWSKETGISNWIAFPIKIERRDQTMRGQLEKIVAGEWKLKNSRLKRNPRARESKWLGQIVVAYTPEPYKELDPKIVMGIDLGVTVPAAVHIRIADKPERWAMCIGRGRDMLNTRAMIRGDIVRLIRALRSKDSPLDDKSREAAMEKLRELRKREQRVMKTASQRIAAQVAKVARRHGAGTWQMEELGAEIKEDKPWLARNWAPGAVKDAIRWWAQKLSAELKFVNPRYTSQRCNACGHIDRANRPKGRQKAAHFECVECAHTDHADKNAARNLSTTGIEEIIRQERPPDE